VMIKQDVERCGYAAHLPRLNAEFRGPKNS
jgi:hypothetical protein